MALSTQKSGSSIRGGRKDGSLFLKDVLQVVCTVKFKSVRTFFISSEGVVAINPLITILSGFSHYN